MDQINNLNQILLALEIIDQDECRKIMSDYDTFIDKIEIMVCIQKKQVAETVRLKHSFQSWITEPENWLNDR